MQTPWIADTARYETARFRRSGRSGLQLPEISLGLWQNFGGVDHVETGRAVLRLAFDRGVTHFDLANNYGPPYGSAEENFGRIFAADFQPYRDELLISTKAGYDMWPGPYGNFGSRKYLVASLDQSLKRMGLDYVDIFYSHRLDPETPLEETMGALDHVVRRGKALYVGISSYSPEATRQAAAILKDLGCGTRLLRRVLRDADVQRLSLPHGGVERAHRLLQRRLRIGPVRIEDVEVVEPHALKRLVTACNEILLGAPLAVGTGPHAIAGLG